jgi:hypothetical protein
LEEKIIRLVDDSLSTIQCAHRREAMTGRATSQKIQLPRSKPKTLAHCRHRYGNNVILPNTDAPVIFSVGLNRDRIYLDCTEHPKVRRSQAFRETTGPGKQIHSSKYASLHWFDAMATILSEVDVHADRTPGCCSAVPTAL